MSTQTEERTLYRATRRARVVVKVVDKTYDLAGFWTGATLSGSSRQAMRQLTVSFINTNNGRRPQLELRDLNGSEARFYDGNDELFRGVVVNYTEDEEGGISFSAYDYNWYLERNQTSAKFSNQTAAQIIRKLCRDFDVPVGEIDDTGHRLKKLIFQGKSLYEIMIIALTETEKKTGKTYRLFNDKGRVSLVERKKNVTWMVVDPGRNLETLSYSHSIEDTATRVRVYNDTYEKYGEATDADGRKKWGLLQTVESDNEAKTTSELRELARQLLRDQRGESSELTFTALGIKGAFSNTGIAVRSRMTRAHGGITS
ncbi:phage-like element PBSX protein XkdQ [Geomicrobium sp. JCM 19037]|uniref:XkdQ/YqbQ family protein n=1 Tax=Geomicrobium sp. JCM 19037 TaxID=1460634 RepID=UPI00045F2E2E|nr:hypothetical protein [Geomicrobium sp. JCM 19037]GAK03248.1 phage-like element PBSX protein XkdQ [Geomicrobium sp. JCM 19037]